MICLLCNGRELRLGALIGSTVVMCVVFLFGFGGVLATWSGLFVPSGPNDYGNTILFSLLDNVNGGRHTAITVVVAVLCAPPPPFLHMHMHALPTITLSYS